MFDFVMNISPTSPIGIALMVLLVVAFVLVYIRLQSWGVSRAVASLFRFSKSSWFWYAIVYLPLSAAIGWILYRFWADSVEIARLHTELEKAKEAAQDAEMRAAQALIAQKKAEAEKELAYHQARAKELEGKIEKGKEQYESKKAAIKRDLAGVRDWDGFFDYLGGSAPNPPGTPQG